MSDAPDLFTPDPPAASARDGVAGEASPRRSATWGSGKWGGWWGGVGGWGGVGLVILCLSVYLPGLWAIPPVDRDESRFAQASRQMHESGDWVVPCVQSKPRLNKPPLIYWCQCASVAVFGDEPGRYTNGNIWVFRLPSVLAAIGSVLVTWRIGRRMFDPRAAWLGAAMLAVCPMVVWDAHQARADQLLLLCTVVTQGAIFVVWRRAMRRPEERSPSWLAPSVFWFALAAGVMTKGPITPMIAGLTVLSLCATTHRWRWVRQLRPLLGVTIVAMVVAPWLIVLTHRLGHPTSEFRDELERSGLALTRGESGWSIYLRVVYDETLGRSAGAKEGHWGPPGYHLVLLTVLFWPGSLLTGLGIARAFRRAFPNRPSADATTRAARLRQFFSRLRSPDFDPPSRFLLCWIVPSWLVFELASTKLPHYTMPLYPAIALISARVVFAADRGVLKGLRDPGSRIGFVIWWIVGVAATLGLSLLVVIAGRVNRSGSVTAAIAPYALPGVLLAILLAVVGRSLVRGRFLRTQALSLVAIVIWGATFLQLILPRAERFWISPRITATLRAPTSLSRGGHGSWNATGFTEDSLVFLRRGRPPTSTSADDALQLSLPTPHDIWIAVPTDSAAAAILADKSPTQRTRVEGLNYSNGKHVDITIFDWLPTGDGRIP